MTPPFQSADAPPRLLLADWVAPMDRPPIRDGAVAVAGNLILDVGPADTLRAALPNATIEILGDVILLPGLVNAHVHLELSAVAVGPPPASFVDWLKRLVSPAPLPEEAVREFVQRSVEMGVAQCLRFGVTSVGDISRHCAVTRPMLRPGPIRTVSFGEVLAMAQRRTLLEPRLAAAADTAMQSDFLRVGVSPHAPYSVETGGYRRCADFAREQRLRLATHLAETPDETPFLKSHTGPFRDLWRFLNAWDDDVPFFVGGPIRMAGLLELPSLLAHVNYCDDAELKLLADSPASVVYCPRTHAYFGHPPHRFQEMLASGINVAAGTDSCASSPDLNLVDDLRLVHQLAPKMPPQAVWQMATLNGARAIGQESRVGSLTPGKAADLVTFPAVGDRPLLSILESIVLPRQVWINGRLMP